MFTMAAPAPWWAFEIGPREKLFTLGNTELNCEDEAVLRGFAKVPLVWLVVAAVVVEVDY